MFEDLGVNEFLKYIKTDIAVIVANDNELEVGKKYLSPYSFKESKYSVNYEGLTVFCGLFGEYSVCLIKTNNQGSIRMGASLDTTRNIIDLLGDNIIIISAGISFGLKNKIQKYGDIIVAQNIAQYDIQRLGDTNVVRAPLVESNEILFNRFSQDNNLIVDEEEYSIFKGQVLTGEKLIDNSKFREQLTIDYPDALGGEMESSGVYKIAKKNNVPVILIKAISDWGDGTKNKDYQKKASAICFEYIKRILSKKEVFLPFNIFPSVCDLELEESGKMTLGSEDILPLFIAKYDIKKYLANKIEHVDYKYYFSDEKGIIFLKNNIKSIPTIIYNLSRKNELKDKILWVFLAKENKSLVENQIIDKIAIISELKKKHNLRIEKTIYINDFINELSEDANMMDKEDNINDEANIYIDQKIYKLNYENDTFSMDDISYGGIIHFNEKIKKHNSFISIITGDGGIGKTKFLDELKIHISNKQIDKKVIFLSSDDIINTTHKNEIASINDLYKIIIEYNEWDYASIDLLKLNFSCGNIVICIDGLEEVHAALGNDFNIKDFFQSLYAVSKTWQNSKILITTREEYLQKNVDLFDLEHVEFYKLRGFEKEDLDKYLDTVYGNNEEKKFDFNTFLCEMNLYDNNGRVSPLFVDWIMKILEDKTTPQKNKFLVIDSEKDIFKKDKLFQLLIQRELDKKNIVINSENSEKLFSILIDLIIENHGKELKFNQFQEICDSHFEENYAEEIAKMTLFSCTYQGKVRVKHSILNILVPARYFMREVLDNKLRSNNIEYILSLFWDGADDRGHMSEITTSFREFLPDSDRYNNLLSNVLLSTQEKLNKYNQNDNEKKFIRRAFSGLFYLIMSINSNIFEKEERSKLLRKLFKSDTFESFSIFGEFYPISFNNLQIKDGYFNNYSNFNECIFPDNKLVFQNTSFKYMNIKNNKHIRKSHFDVDCIFFQSNIEKIAFTSEKLQENKIETAKDFLSALATFIRLGQKSQNLIKRYVRPKPKNLTLTLKSLTDEHKFLIKLKKGNKIEYKLKKGNDADKLKMKDFSGYDNLILYLSKEM